MLKTRSFVKLALVGVLATTAAGCMVRGHAHGTVRVPAPYVVVDVAPPPPPPRHTVIQVRPGYIWIDGYHRWDGRRYVWVDGRYERERPGYRWHPGRWERRGRGHVWIEGEWRASGRVNTRDRRSQHRDHRR